MATDAEVLTAARDVAEALAVCKAAEGARVLSGQALDLATRKLDEAKVRLAAAERRVVELSRQRPAEPAARVAPEAPREYTPTITPALASPAAGSPPQEYEPPRGHSVMTKPAPQSAPVPNISGPRRPRG
jgi:hypothetical protein